MRIKSRYNIKRLMSFKTIKKYSPLGGWGAFLLLSLLLFSCSKESVQDYAEEHEVKFGVGFVDIWEKGNFNENKAKAVTRGNLTLLEPPTAPILHLVYVKATDKENSSTKDLRLRNKNTAGELNSESVTEFEILPHGEITEENYTLYNYDARAIVPDDGLMELTSVTYDNVWGADATIPLYGDKDYLSGTGVADDALRVYFPLKHNTVLVRLAIGVSSEIDAIRTLKLTSLKIYKSTGLGTDGKLEFATTEFVSKTFTDPDALKPTGKECIQFHVNPNSAELFEDVSKEVEKGYLRTVLIVAQYDVYDKDNKLLRKGCVARNTLTLGFTSKAKGRYFDIYATIKPDFLYVLSDGDKEMADVVLK